MNKQELITRLIKLLEAPSEIEGSDFDHGHNYGIERAILLAEHLNEQQPQMNKQEKPVVPQFVADFYESIKDDFEDGVYELCIQLYNCDLDGRINFWFGCNDNKPIETLVKMKLYGYEVEKEKLYRVELPGSHKHGDIILVKDDDGDITYDVVFSDKWKERDYTKLTESEIKQDFDWAWQFAEEVEDDTKI